MRYIADRCATEPLPLLDNLRDVRLPLPFASLPPVLFDCYKSRVLLISLRQPLIIECQDHRYPVVTQMGCPYFAQTIAAMDHQTRVHLLVSVQPPFLPAISN